MPNGRSILAFIASLTLIFVIGFGGRSYISGPSVVLLAGSAVMTAIGLASYVWHRGRPRREMARKLQRLRDLAVL